MYNTLTHGSIKSSGLLASLNSTIRSVAELVFPYCPEVAQAFPSSPRVRRICWMEAYRTVFNADREKSREAVVEQSRRLKCTDPGKRQYCMIAANLVAKVQQVTRLQVFQIGASGAEPHAGLSLDHGHRAALDLTSQFSPTMSLFGRSRAKSLTLVLPPAPTPAPTPATSLSCGRGRSPNPQGFGRHIRSPLASLEPSLTPTPDPEAHPEGQAISPANEKELSGTMDGSRKKRRRSQEGSENTDEWLRVLQPTLVLKNSGSVARDHLASERTFLAYVRTSIGISTVGIGEPTALHKPAIPQPCSRLPQLLFSS